MRLIDRNQAVLFVALCVLVSTFPALGHYGEAKEVGEKPALTTLAELERLGHSRINAVPRISLLDGASEKLKTINFADPLEGGQVPNYIRALAQQTPGAGQFAQMMRTFLYGGTVPPETK